MKTSSGVLKSLKIFDIKQNVNFKKSISNFHTVSPKCWRQWQQSEREYRAMLIFKQLRVKESQCGLNLIAPGRLIHRSKA